MTNEEWKCRAESTSATKRTTSVIKIFIVWSYKIDMLCRLFFHLLIPVDFFLFLFCFVLYSIFLPEAINVGCRHPILVGFSSLYFFSLLHIIYMVHDMLMRSITISMLFQVAANKDKKRWFAWKTSELAASSKIEEKRPQFTQILCAEKLRESDLDLIGVCRDR